MEKCILFFNWVWKNVGNKTLQREVVNITYLFYY